MNSTNQSIKAPTENALKLNEQYIGQKFGYLTILELDGAHPNSGAVLVKVRCDCGKQLGGLLRSDVTRGARICCSKKACPVYLQGKNRSKSIAKRKSTARVQSLAPVVSQNGLGGGARPGRAREGTSQGCSCLGEG